MPEWHITLAPKRCSYSNPLNLWLSYVTRQRGIESTDGMKVAILLTLKQREYSGLHRWAQCSHKSL